MEGVQEAEQFLWMRVILANVEIGMQVYLTGLSCHSTPETTRDKAKLMSGQTHEEDLRRLVYKTSLTKQQSAIILRIHGLRKGDVVGRGWPHRFGSAARIKSRNLLDSPLSRPKGSQTKYCSKCWEVSRPVSGQKVTSASRSK